ncbi:MAG: response regulator [Bacteroidota bacterium]|nr:response regulator [Bacteroidota bacterium]
MKSAGTLKKAKFSIPEKDEKGVFSIREKDAVEVAKEIKHLKVLVGEDMRLNQLLMKIILTDFGFEHDIVSNGKLIIEKLLANSYDIILMDLHMPEMDGFEAAEYIRVTMNSKIPIIALTADAIPADLEKFMASGMNDYISKPVEDDLLYSKMVSLVENSTFAK